MANWKPLTLAVASAALGYFLRGYVHSPSRSDGGSRSAAPNVSTPSPDVRSVGSGESRAVSPMSVRQDKPQIEAAVSAALREMDMFKRNRQWMELLSSNDVEKLEWMLGEVHRCHRLGLDTAEAGDLLSTRLGQLLGEAGMQRLPAEPNGRPDYALQFRLRGWTQVDPLAAMKWLDTLENGRTKEDLTKRWLQSLKEADPVKLTEDFSSLPPTAQGNCVGTLLLGKFVEGGAQAARNWYASFSQSADPETRKLAYSALVDRMAQDGDNLRASGEAIRDAAGGNAELLYEGFKKYSWRSSRADPGATLDELSSFSQLSPVVKAHQPELLQQIFDWGSMKSLNAFGDWLNQHRQSPIFDQVASEFAVRTQKDDAESARRWAETIKDEKLRAQTLQRLQQ